MDDNSNLWSEHLHSALGLSWRPKSSQILWAGANSSIQPPLSWFRESKSAHRKHEALCHDSKTAPGTSRRKSTFTLGTADFTAVKACFHCDSHSTNATEVNTVLPGLESWEKPHWRLMIYVASHMNFATAVKSLHGSVLSSRVALQ